MSNTDNVIKKAEYQLKRNQMFIDYYHLVENNKEFSIIRLNEMLNFFKEEEKFDYCVNIKHELDELMDN